MDEACWEGQHMSLGGWLSKRGWVCRGECEWMGEGQTKYSEANGNVNNYWVDENGMAKGGDEAWDVKGPLGG